MVSPETAWETLTFVVWLPTSVSGVCRPYAVVVPYWNW
jgi:hypothetical protein